MALKAINSSLWTNKATNWSIGTSIEGIAGISLPFNQTEFFTNGTTQDYVYSTTTISNMLSESTGLLSDATAGSTQLMTFSTTQVVRNQSKMVNITDGEFFDRANEAVLINVLLPSLIYTCISLALGVPGNIFVLYIYGFRWNKSTSRIFILALAALDLLNCVSSLSTEIVLLVNYLKFDHPYLCKWTRSVTSFCNNTTGVILLTIAVDRFKRICRPLKTPVNVQLAKKIVYFSVIFGLATSWPFFVLYGTFTITLPKPEIGVTFVGKTCLIDDYYIKTIYPLILVAFLFFLQIGCDIVFVVLYAFIGRALMRQKRTRKSLKGFTYNPEVSTNSCTNDDLDDEATSKKTTSFKRFKQKISLKRFLSKSESEMSSDQSEEAEHINKRQSMVKNTSHPHRGDFIRRQITKLSRNASVSSSTSGATHTRKTTLMLFLVTLVFVLSYLPYCIVVVLRYVDRQLYTNASNAGRALIQLFLRSYFLNSVLNPIVYSFISNKFKAQVVLTFKRCTSCHDDSGN